VVIRNDTQRKLFVACVSFKVVDSLGNSGGAYQCYGDYPAPAPLLRPGDAMLAAPERGYSVSPGSKPAMKSGRAPGYYSSSQSVAISVESVILGTGKFVGPDQLDRFDYYASRMAAMRDIGMALNGLASQGPAAIDQYLSALLAARSNAATAVATQPSFQSEYAMNMAGLAQVVKGQFDQFGDNGARGAAASYLRKANAPAIHK
jgi:hypothetical protein